MNATASSANLPRVLRSPLKTGVSFSAADLILSLQNCLMQSSAFSIVVTVEYIFANAQYTFAAAEYIFAAANQ